MQTLTLAETKSHLSAVVDQVEAGAEIVITRRGRPVARIVPESSIDEAEARAWVDELSGFVLAQSEQARSASQLVRELRDEARY